MTRERKQSTDVRNIPGDITRDPIDTERIMRKQNLPTNLTNRQDEWREKSNYDAISITAMADSPGSSWMDHQSYPRLGLHGPAFYTPILIVIKWRPPREEVWPWVRQLSAAETIFEGAYKCLPIACLAAQGLIPSLKGDLGGTSQCPPQVPLEIFLFKTVQHCQWHDRVTWGREEERIKDMMTY